MIEIPSMDTETAIIASRFNGPPNSGNGGYTCGILGSLIGDCAEVTLRKPPPLDTELTVEHVDGDWTLSDGESIVATGREADLQLDVPPPPAFEAAEAAEPNYIGFHEHPFPTCFVCGPDREPGDGLRLFTGKVDGRDIVATHWTPGDDVAGKYGQVQVRVLWGALDCPTYFGGALAGYDKMAVLGRLTAKLIEPVRVGQPHIVVAWPLEDEDKRWNGGSAIFTADGTLCAYARGTWVRVDASFPGITT